MELAKVMCVRNDEVRVNRKALQAVLGQCQLALQQLAVFDDDVDGEVDAPQEFMDTLKFCGLLKPRFEGADFITKLEHAQSSLQRNMAEEDSSWDMVSENDTWGGGNVELETEDYVLLQEDDVTEGIATFLAACLLSLEQTKDLTPNQLQQALSKAFSMKKKKGKLWKAWDGSKVIYNVASWGATVIGMYQNPAILSAASIAFWNSCRVLSKLL